MEFLDGSKHRGYADRGMNIHEQPLLGRYGELNILSPANVPL